MKRRFNKVVLVLLLAVVLLQGYQPARNEGGLQQPGDITRVYHTPPAVTGILTLSCYDCHSNNTRYVWYDYIQPLRLLVENHIARGKAALNFSEWAAYSARKQERLLLSMVSQVTQQKMPLPSYTWLHGDATVGEAQRKLLIAWLDHQLAGGQ